MTKARLLNRVRDLRERLRDAQAGVANQAMASALEAQAAEERARAAGDERVASCLDELTARQSAAALFRLDDERRWRNSEAAALAKASEQAEAHAASERRELSARERSLRSIERALAKNRELRLKTESRAEQGASDDLSGAKVSRGTK